MNYLDKKTVIVTGAATAKALNEMAIEPEDISRTVVSF